jgi:hypothetical protein
MRTNQGRLVFSLVLIQFVFFWRFVNQGEDLSPCDNRVVGNLPLLVDSDDVTPSVGNPLISFQTLFDINLFNFKDLFVFHMREPSFGGFTGTIARIAKR